MAETTNEFEMAQRQFDHVAELLKLDPQVREILRWPLREFLSASPSAWMTAPSACSRVFACNTTMCAAQ